MHQAPIIIIVIPCIHAAAPAVAAAAAMLQVEAVAASPFWSPWDMFTHAVLDWFGNKSARDKVEQQVGLALTLHVIDVVRTVL
jgi:hypothetical protein